MEIMSNEKAPDFLKLLLPFLFFLSFAPHYCDPANFQFYFFFHCRKAKYFTDQKFQTILVQKLNCAHCSILITVAKLQSILLWHKNSHLQIELRENGIREGLKIYY